MAGQAARVKPAFRLGPCGPAVEARFAAARLSA